MSEAETIELSSALASPTVLPATITLQDAIFVVAAPCRIAGNRGYGRDQRDV